MKNLQPTIKTLIIDDHILVSKGLTEMLLNDKAISVVGTAAKGIDGIRMVRKQQPHVVILDLKLPDISGIEVARRLMNMDPNLNILILTATEQTWFSMHLLAQGVKGFLTKDTPKENLIAAIKSIVNGKKLAVHPTTLLPKNFQTLSNRELEIILMTIRNYSIQAMAKHLCLDIKTIHSYRSRIYKKLQVKNSIELVNYLISHKIFIPEDLIYFN